MALYPETIKFGRKEGVLLEPETNNQDKRGLHQIIIPTYLLHWKALHLMMRSLSTTLIVDLFEIDNLYYWMSHFPTIMIANIIVNDIP